MRSSHISRKTSETQIEISIDLDNTSQSTIATGIGFLDHMLELFAKHSGFSLNIQCKGDLQVDCHHTAEDIGIVLGQSIKDALGNKVGIERYGFSAVPMDEALVTCICDFSGRSYLVYDLNIPSEKIGDISSESIREFFLALSNNAQMNLHLTQSYGLNSHHIVEAAFKSTARAMKAASRITSNELPSSKGLL